MSSMHRIESHEDWPVYYLFPPDGTSDDVEVPDDLVERYHQAEGDWSAVQLEIGRLKETCSICNGRDGHEIGCENMDKYQNG